MNRQRILTRILILTVGVCAALSVADYRLTQEIQELEESLGLFGVRIEKVEGADSDKGNEPERTGSSEI